MKASNDNNFRHIVDNLFAPLSINPPIALFYPHGKIQGMPSASCELEQLNQTREIKQEALFLILLPCPGDVRSFISL